MDRGDFRTALAHPNVQAFLRVIRHGESGQGANAYGMISGGGSYMGPPWRHPYEGQKAPPGKAWGAYQFIPSTAAALIRMYGFEDMNPDNQDEMAVALIAGRGALMDVMAGRIEVAIGKCVREWTSLPGAAESNMSLGEAFDIYLAHGGTFAGEQPAPEVEPREEPTEQPKPQPETGGHWTMPITALIAAFGPILVDLIPQIAKLFKPGSEVAERNVAAASAVFNTVVAASKQPNIQAAIEAMQKNPDVRREVVNAVVTDPVIVGLLEVGGGIPEARRAASDPGQIPIYRNPALIFTVMVLPLVYMVATSILFGVGGQKWSEDIKTLFVTAIITGALGSLTGFWLGSSLGSQSKDVTLMRK